MDATELIEKFFEFLDLYCKEKILRVDSSELESLKIDFVDLTKFDLDLAEGLMENPEDTIKACELALKQFDIKKKIYVRFFNFPKTDNTLISNIRSKHINKLLVLEGLVRQKGDVRPLVTDAKFECPSCGNIISMLQLDSKFREPEKCGCGRKGKFRLLSKTMIDAQRIVLEEIPEQIESGAQPKRISVILKNDLVSPLTEKKTNPGSTVMVAGILKEVERIDKQGAKSTLYDLIIEGNYIEPSQKDFSQLSITEEEEKKIIEISKDKELKIKLIHSMAPTIYGYDLVKEALLLQMFSGVTRDSKTGTKSRGNIHILLIGDPGSGKCLHGSTKIILSDGSIKQISDVCDSHPKNLGLTSLYTDGKMNIGNVSRVWKRKTTEKLLFIKTRMGKELKVTKNHPLFCIQNGFIVAKQASDYKTGEYIATPRKIDVCSSTQILPVFLCKYVKNTKPLFFPVVLDDTLARFLGYFCGDGYLTYSKTSGWVSLTNNDDDVQTDFSKQLKFLFRKNTTIRHSHKGKTAKESYVTSKPIVDYMTENFNELFGGSSNKTIPELVLKSKNDVLASFIKGLFECDAHVNIKKRQIEFCSISKDLAEKLQCSLLRFGIISLLKKKNKFASNTLQKRKVFAYEVIISGNFVKNYANLIGFVSKRKKLQLSKLIRSTTYYNTNIDVVPNINSILKMIRNDFSLLQKEMGISISTYAHFEQNNRLPSVSTLKRITTHLKNKGFSSTYLDNLHQIAISDVFWDEITEIKQINNDEEYVYDFEIEHVHNFVANGVVVHNSQLLKRAAAIAPKAQFVSGKGTSGAGLCVSKDSMICTNPGGVSQIGQYVDTHINELVPEFRSGVWKKDNPCDVKIQSMSVDLKIQSKYPKAVWKLKSPKNMYSVTLSGGKNILITENTCMMTIKDGNIIWKKAKDFSLNDYAATPRILTGGNIKESYVIDLISSNPTLYGVKSYVKYILNDISRKYGGIRNAAKKLKVGENNLYHHWVNECARGNISLSDFKKLCIHSKFSKDWKEKISVVSLYNGKRHLLPIKLSSDFLYVCGLIAGDGDIQKTKFGGISVRLSNSEDILHKIFQDVLKKEFGLSCNITLGNERRPKASRTNSKLLGEIMISLGIPFSPKSDKIDPTDELLHLDNELLSHYIAGLYDTDGCVYERKKKGSNCVDLTTCSENLARKLQIAFLRFNIRASIRRREPSTGKIKGKLKKWILEIRGHDQICLFSENIKLRHPKKKSLLEKICKKNVKYSTNIDIIPEMSDRIKKELQKQKISLRKAGWHNKLSRKFCIDLLNKMKNNKEVLEMKKIANSDIFWEKIKNIEIVHSKDEFVYDLTVEDSHNFTVNGILIHNTASVVKDEFMGGWALEAGALVLGNKGQVMIDELDKMSPEDTSAMHEALEQQQISIAKANIRATLLCETTVLAAANPKFGRFDPYENIAKQIDLPSTLMNRFDLIFPIRDLPNEAMDKQISGHILKIRTDVDIEKEVPINTDLLRKYIAYAKQHCKPNLNEESIKMIQDFYVSMRNQNKSDDGPSPIPINARNLEALIRLSEASAKMRLNEVVTKEDVKIAIELVKFCLMQVGIDPDTGKIDIDRLESGITSSQRNKIILVKKVINDLAEKTGNMVSIEDVIEACKDLKIDAEVAEESIEKLKRSGDIFEPKKNFISRIQ